MGIHKISKRSRVSVHLTQEAVGRWQLQFQSLASRGQHSSTSGPVWGPWCGPDKSPALALDVKRALSTGPTETWGKAFSTTLQMGSSSTDSPTHSARHTVSTKMTVRALAL